MLGVAGAPSKGYIHVLVSATFRSPQVYITELYGDISFCIAMAYQDSDPVDMLVCVNPAEPSSKPCTYSPFNVNCPPLRFVRLAPADMIARKKGKD